MDSDIALADNTSASRIEATVDGHLAKLDYRVDGTDLILVHTEVPEELGGQGIGGQLVAAALAKARGGGLVVVPRCSFARTWLEERAKAEEGVEIAWDR